MHQQQQQQHTQHQDLIKKSNQRAFQESLAASIDPSTLPKHCDTNELEAKWRREWETRGIYRYDPDAPREETFIIDTPPPTVSGHLHVGHIFSYTHTDIIARYKRMSGFNIFYPMGWDDNGLPTERRVQNFFNVWCDPHAKYDSSLINQMKERQIKILEIEKLNEAANNKKGGKKKKQPELTKRQTISRKNFIELCGLVTEEDEKQFRNLFQSIGLSVDWDLMYSTINRHCQTISQLSFLDLFKKDQIYSSFSPHMWDIDFQTAVAHADSEERTQVANYHHIAFGIEGANKDKNNYFTIATTRPELLAACIGITAHPDDPRYQHLFGKRAITPLFKTPVPIFPSKRAAIDKGTGIVMICTFGDQTDIQWWREQNLPLRQIIGRDGKLLPAKKILFSSEKEIETEIEKNKNKNENEKEKEEKEKKEEKNKNEKGWPSLDPERANRYYSQLAGLSTKAARAKILDLLREKEALPFSEMEIEAPLLEISQPFAHAVKFFEKGDRPLEYIPTRQWFVRLLDKKEELLAKNEELKWHPDWMKIKFSDWTKNQNQDWCISRQRYFGVSIPIWYHCKGDSGKPDFEKSPILPDSTQLPIDPMIDCPPGFSEEQRGQPGGFIGESDVFDTWFTSSMTPQINSWWNLDSDRHSKIFPMDLRPQSHEIIRTWTFYTVAKALMHEGKLPWKQITISGWVLDPAKEKMSKSKGNVITPAPLLSLYGADAVRYWASNANLGSDTAFEERIFTIGKRLVTKIFNAGKAAYAHDISEDLKKLTKDLQINYSEESDWATRRLINMDLDISFLMALKKLIKEATSAFEKFDFASARRAIESFFWSKFTDNFLEMSKSRTWQKFDETESKKKMIGERISAILSLRLAMDILLRLLAPFAPYITEEVWSWTHKSSIHAKGSWPTEEELSGFEHPLANLSNEEEKLRPFETAIAAITAIRKAKDSEMARLKSRPKEEQTTKIKLGILKATLRVSSEEEKAALLSHGMLQDILGGFSFQGDWNENILIEVDPLCPAGEIIALIEWTQNC